MGIVLEDGVAQQYKILSENQENTKIELGESGLKVSLKKGFIAASADRIATDAKERQDLLK